MGRSRSLRFFFLCSLKFGNAIGSFFFKGTLLGKQKFQDKSQNICYRINFMQGFDHLLIVLTEIRPLINANRIFLVSNNNSWLGGSSKASLLVILRGGVIWTLHQWPLQRVVLLRYSLLLQPSQKHSCLICTSWWYTEVSPHSGTWLPESRFCLACLGDWVTESVGSQSRRAKEPRMAGNS